MSTAKFLRAPGNGFRKSPSLQIASFLYSIFFAYRVEPYLKRFISMGIPPEKLFVTGNLKFDIPLQKMGNVEKTVLLETLNIKDTDPVVVIGSTHAPEEEWLISALEPRLEGNSQPQGAPSPTPSGKI